MRAIIPVAGTDSRPRLYSHKQPQALVPVAGKPIIAHIVDFLLGGGVSEFVFVISRTGVRIKDFLGSYYADREIPMSFVVQEKRQGTAHALLTAIDHLHGLDELAIMFGDTILHLDLPTFLKQTVNVVGVKKVESPCDFGIAEVDRVGNVRHLIEKPRIPKSNLGLVGFYKIVDTQLLEEGLRYVVNEQIKVDGEYHLTSALMYMVEKGANFKISEVDHWYDCGKKESLLAANAELLSRPDFVRSYQADFPNTVLIQPVKIGGNCHVSNSIIGPNVVIGDHSHIENCILDNSIIGSFSHLDHLILKDSLVGNESTLLGLSQNLNVGDNAEITLTGTIN